MRDTSRLTSFLAENAPFYFLCACMAFFLKLHYSVATGSDLQWILLPTAGLVEAVSGIPFEPEAQAGLISKDFGLILIPACAGVNFLITAFCILAFSNLHRIGSARGKLLWIGISAAAVYFLTVGVNAIRIIGAAHLYRADIYSGWATQERMHRIWGATLYFLFLLPVYPVGERAARWLGVREGRERPPGAAQPYDHGRLIRGFAIVFAWYILVVIGIPVLNSAWKGNPPQFVEHCATILALWIVLLPLFFLIVLGARWMSQWPRKKS